MTGIIEVDGKEAESVSLIFELVDLRLENKRLRARVGEMEARYDSVTVALQEKCDELTAIKADIATTLVNFTQSQRAHALAVTENAELRAAMAIADKRLLDATNRIGAIPAGCDTAEWLVDEIIRLRAELAAIKPDWNDAPKWAVGVVERRNGARFWTNERNGGGLKMFAVNPEWRIEARPEES